MISTTSQAQPLSSSTTTSTTFSISSGRRKSESKRHSTTTPTLTNDGLDVGRFSIIDRRAKESESSSSNSSICSSYGSSLNDEATNIDAVADNSNATAVIYHHHYDRLVPKNARGDVLTTAAINDNGSRDVATSTTTAVGMCSHIFVVCNTANKTGSLPTPLLLFLQSK